jgi:hypothetical protein
MASRLVFLGARRGRGEDLVPGLLRESRDTEDDADDGILGPAQPRGMGIGAVRSERRRFPLGLDQVPVCPVRSGEVGLPWSGDTGVADDSEVRSLKRSFQQVFQP